MAKRIKIGKGVKNAVKNVKNATASVKTAVTKEIAKDVKKVRNKIEDVKTDLQSKLNKVKELERYALLLPFLAPMAAILQAKGVKTSGLNIMEVTDLFAYKVLGMAVKHNADSPTGKLTMMGGDTSNPLVSTLGAVGGAAGGAALGLPPEVGGKAGSVIATGIEGVIKAVIAFFKQMKSRKEAGEQLPDVIEKGIDMLNRTQDEINRDENESSSDFLKYLLIGLGAFIVIKLLTK